jgi:hypothetical protein
MSWGSNAQQQAVVEGPSYGLEYYRELFSKPRDIRSPVRMALVGRENTAKTGLALDLARTEQDVKDGKKVIIIDCDKSAMETVSHVVDDPENILIYSMDDAADDSIFKEDGVTIDYRALIEKTGYFANIIAEQVAADKDSYAAIIFDGASSYMKWCEYAMTDVLLRRGVIKEEGDRFNQAEWRTRNQLFRDTLNRFHTIDVDKVFFTFHRKDVQQYVDGGLMKIGEKVDWVDGTQRIMSQQIFLQRFTKKGDRTAGVEKDNSLGDDDFVIRATIEEIKGRGMEHIGSVHEILKVSKGKVTWEGISELRW